MHMLVLLQDVNPGVQLLYHGPSAAPDLLEMVKVFFEVVLIYIHISLAVLGSWEPGAQFNYCSLPLG